MSPPPSPSGDRPSRLLPDRVVEVDGRPDELDRLRRERDEARAKLQANARAQYTASLSPPGGMPRIVEAAPPSLTPPHVKQWAAVLRAAGPKGAALVLLAGVFLWGLDGSTGIARIVSAWRAAEYTEQLQVYTARVAALETRVGRCEAGRVADHNNETAFRSDLSQVLERLGAQWSMPDGITPQRELKFVSPIRRPGVVTKGPSVVVMQPVPLPPAISSSAP